MLTNVFVDEAGYSLLPSENSIFDHFGVDKNAGAVVVVRPDTCKLPPVQTQHLTLPEIKRSIDISRTVSIGDESLIRDFFKGCLSPV